MNYIAGMKNYFEKEKAVIDSLNLEEMNQAVMHTRAFLVDKRVRNHQKLRNS